MQRSRECPTAVHFSHIRLCVFSKQVFFRLKPSFSAANFPWIPFIFPCWFFLVAWFRLFIFPCLFFRLFIFPCLFFRLYFSVLIFPCLFSLFIFFGFVQFHFHFPYRVGFFVSFLLLGIKCPLKPKQRPAWLPLLTDLDPQSSSSHTNSPTAYHRFPDQLQHFEAPPPATLHRTAVPFPPPTHSHPLPRTTPSNLPTSPDLNDTTRFPPPPSPLLRDYPREDPPPNRETDTEKTPTLSRHHIVACDAVGTQSRSTATESVGGVRNPRHNINHVNSLPTCPLLKTTSARSSSGTAGVFPPWVVWYFVTRRGEFRTETGKYRWEIQSHTPTKRYWMRLRGCWRVWATNWTWPCTSWRMRPFDVFFHSGILPMYSRGQNPGRLQAAPPVGD